METNESILTRSVVGLKDRKVLGTINELRVDCDSLAVCDYVVKSQTTNSSLALPFESAIAVGDTFVTIESRDDFLPAGSSDAQAVLDGYKLLGVEAYSRTGNKLAAVKGFEFDPVFGKVTSLTLEDGKSFPASDFVFFAEDFIFVDDHVASAAELRAQGAKADDTQAAQSSAGEAAADADEGLATAEAEVEVAEEAAEAEDASEASEDDAALMEFLVGSTISEDVTSADGEFTVAGGTELTQELVEEARAHDALLLLTMSVED